MAYDPRRHHRRSIRKKGHDYTAAGAYSITICTQNRDHLFCQITHGQVHLHPAGMLVEAIWHRLPCHFPTVTLDAFVVMPDHVHGIIILGENKRSKTYPPTDWPKGTIPGSIPAIVQNFKSVSSRRINQAMGTPGRRIWQEDYYDRIIRDASHLEHTRQYIAANPSRWRG